MTNYKKQFEDYIDATNKSGSGKAKSYIRALDLLSNILSLKSLGFDDCIKIWEVDSLDRLSLLRDETLNQAKKGQASSWAVEEIPPSYLKSNYMSAALGSYIKFHSDINIKLEEAKEALGSKQSSLGYIDKEKIDNWLEADNDEKESRQLVAIKIRGGQSKFRKNILKKYNFKCAVTGCSTTDVLEAAHILHHSESGINHSSNGILLRSDIHVLFDLDKLKINPKSFRIEIDKSLKSSEYFKYNKKMIAKDINEQLPNINFLNERYYKEKK